MPKHTRNELFNPNEEKLSTFSQQRPQALNQQHPKIPPKPPPRRTLPIRYEPEGMQPQTATANFQERKNFPLAIVQKSEKLCSKVPLTSINFNHQQHLLHHAKPQHFSSSQNHNMNQQHHNNNNFNNNFIMPPQQVFLRPSPLQHQQLVIANMQMRMNVMKMKNGHSTESSGSDPENHIYEMIDEYEVSGQKKEILLASPPQLPPQQSVTNESDDLFQNLLRTEMVQLCGRSSAYMSHLSHEKRIDIIQETALSLATAAYQEK